MTHVLRLCACKCASNDLAFPPPPLTRTACPKYCCHVAVYEPSHLRQPPPLARLPLQDCHCRTATARMLLQDCHCKTATARLLLQLRLLRLRLLRLRLLQLRLLRLRLLQLRLQSPRLRLLLFHRHFRTQSLPYLLPPNHNHCKEHHEASLDLDQQHSPAAGPHQKVLHNSSQSRRALDRDSQDTHVHAHLFERDAHAIAVQQRVQQLWIHKCGCVLAPLDDVEHVPRQQHNGQPQVAAHTVGCLARREAAGAYVGVKRGGSEEVWEAS
eukprot:366466-Chlamydomonas_euryale.AAC.1